MENLLSEPLPRRQEEDLLYIVTQMPGFPGKKIECEKDVNHAEYVNMAECYLNKRIKGGSQHAAFLLGQLYFKEEWYEDALLQFEKIKDEDYQALYQAGVIYYDGLGTREDQTKGVEYMKRIVNSNSSQAAHLKFAAAYNLGRACYEGYGMVHSDEEAERWWLIAADDGNPEASVKAQSVLGMYYSHPPHKNLKKAFYWHSEACGNGSLESQGALGVMYLYGYGVQKNLESALECLKEAAERGNVYAQGQLVSCYYQRKLYAMAAELAKMIVQYDNLDLIAKATDCLSTYVTKGVAMANFYLARCLHCGVGIKTGPDQSAAKYYYTRACLLDPDVASDLQANVIYGRI